MQALVAQLGQGVAIHFDPEQTDGNGLSDGVAFLKAHTKSTTLVPVPFRVVDENAVATDVGLTKPEVHAAVQSALIDAEFALVVHDVRFAKRAE